MSAKENVPTTASEDIQNQLTDTDTTRATVDSTTSSKDLDSNALLSADHLAELRGSAVSDEVIASSSAYTAYEKDDLPEPLKWIANFENALPALVYPLEEAGKGTTWQVKPQPSAVKFADGRTPKYICPAKNSGYPTPALVERRAVNDKTRRVLLVEGTKQALAALSATGADTAVYGLTGITSWRGGVDGPSPAFQLVGGFPTYIIADADAATNRMVYDGAEDLGTLCRQWGASPARFVNVPGGGKQGLDDLLAVISDDRREDMLELWIKQAGDKPCKKRPAQTQTNTASTMQTESRKPSVDSDLDAEFFHDTVDQAVYNKYAGTKLFRSGDKLVALETRDDRKQLDVVEIPYAIDLAAQAIRVKQVMTKKTRVRALTNTEAGIIFNKSRASKYSNIRGITETPVLSKEGTIVCQSGYDPETGLYVDLSDNLEGFSVPEAPTHGDVQAARELLEEAYADFPFKKEADRTRALGMLLTLLVRPACPTAPMHVVTANNRGTGKGLLLSITSLIASGHDAHLQKLPFHDEEMEKLLYSALLAGRTQLMFDEAGEGLESLALASMLTGTHFGGRILGESKHELVVNSACVFAAGNNVAVKKDLARRSIMVEMETPLANPEARDDFQHPDLKAWVRENRKALLQAAFTLIRAWIVAGKPAPITGQDTGSFNEWYEAVGGILAFAGRADLMEGVREQRERRNESDLEDLAHIDWLYRTFDSPFRAFAAQNAIQESQIDGEFVPLPSDLRSPSEATAQRLGRFYTKMQNRTIGGYVMKVVGMLNHTKLFDVVHVGPDDGDDGGNGGGTPPPRPPAPLTEDTGTTVVFDLETGDADDLHVIEVPGFVRLATYSVNGAEPVATTDIAGELIPLLEKADTIVGHNVLQYDLPALQRLYGLDVKALIKADRVRDTLVMARLRAGGDKNLKYDLDTVTSRCGVDGKLLADGETALKALAKQFGGFDKIPVENPDYVEYALQDVRANVAVYEKLLTSVGKEINQDYLRLEHAKMHALAVVEARGIRVDTSKVDQFLAEEEQTKGEIRTWLIDTVGIPDEGKSPWASAAGKQVIADYLSQFNVAAPRTSKGSISTSTKALNELAEKHPDVPEVVELAAKMETLLHASTPASTINKYLRGDRVYPSIKSIQATGRLSTTKPGMTVFGSRGEWLIRQREMILPDSTDEALVSVDLSQIDARCMAAGSGDANYAQLFTPGRDAHTEMALRVFGDASRRSDAKALAHAANYGMGQKSFAQHAGISEVEATKQLERLHYEFPALEKFKDHLRKHAEAHGWIPTGFGRRVTVDRAKAYTRGPAAYGQGTARDVFLEGVLNLPAEVLEMVRIFVHDEIVLSVPRDRAEEIKHTVMGAFQAVKLPNTGGVDVPVLSDSAGPAESWAGCQDN
ncbi:DNA polymerase I [Corynebacterium ammoniagenes]|uniref:DNA polymerase n=1 Tax=Corynebacterium ammoniagenes TaxID=1697 RepID=UPI0014593F3E|nr:DNA polymerase [Corynebacterium ammoniagenes]NMF32691.1 DNA polymerase I [Corynebacterium ammoniagenes]